MAQSARCLRMTGFFTNLSAALFEAECLRAWELQCTLNTSLLYNSSVYKLGYPAQVLGSPLTTALQPTSKSSRNRRFLVRVFQSGSLTFSLLLTCRRRRSVQDLPKRRYPTHLVWFPPNQPNRHPPKRWPPPIYQPRGALCGRL